jgi:hypothetical protein
MSRRNFLDTNVSERPKAGRGEDNIHSTCNAFEQHSGSDVEKDEQF